MISHVTLRVSDLEKSKKFFATALAPLGYKLLFEKETSAGFGQQDAKSSRDFWIKAGDTVWLKETKESKVRSFSCLAFTATSKEQVERFYNVARAAGATDNGAPGYRPSYYDGYYAAYVLDPVDGYNIEAVFDDEVKTQKL
jgi:catechol 2,3-dioxygenase-like lactoylglutathione lyase family enzyme